MQVYSILKQLYYTLKGLGGTEKFVSWKSEGLWTEYFTTSTTIGNSFSPSIKWHNDTNVSLKFKESYLKQRNATFTTPDKINFFIAYKLDTSSGDLNSDFTLKDCLFGDINVVKNDDPNKYVYSGYSTLFDSCAGF